jgi:hypothetical protein
MVVSEAARAPRPNGDISAVKWLMEDRNSGRAILQVSEQQWRLGLGECWTAEVKQSGGRVGARLQRARSEAKSLVRGLFTPQFRKP